MFGYAAKLAGTVYDSQGESLVGALVKVDDGKYAALTGPDGSFSFDLTDGAHSISAEFMGCEKYDKRLNLSSDKHIKITLHEMATDLDEVVVSATATREKLKDRRKKSRDSGAGKDAFVFRRKRHNEEHSDVAWREC